MALSLDEALGMSLADETDESIHVDIDTRQVMIPESQQVFGVESDEDVEVKHIVIDGRYNDGTDLSTFTFRVNYQNANPDPTNNKGTYLVTEIKVNEDSIEFDWVIGRKVVAYKGVVAFIVRAEIVNSDGIIQNEWNSTLGKGTTLEGLEVSEFDFGDDIVRQLASILSDVNAAQASAKASADEAYKSKTEVVALGKEQQAAIEKKGKDTLATIPEDYTQVSNDVSQLKEDTAKLKDGKISKFYASSQGNTNLPDSDDGRIMDLMLYGKSEQKQYSGKNLVGELMPGVIVWNTGDYISSEARYACTDFIPVKPGEKYTISNATKNAERWYYDSNKKPVIGMPTGNITVTIPENVSYMRITCLTENKDKFQIEKGSNATDYEPYVGGIPSPNPEYPQEIKSVVKPVIKVMGKNLLNPDTFKTDSITEHGVTCKLVTDETGTYFLLNGTANALIDFWISKKIFVYDGSANNLTISVREACPESYYLCVQRVNADFKGQTAVTTSLKEFSFYIHVLNGAAINNYRIYIQVEAGETATAYEPYTEEAVTLPYTLNAIPVSSGGNVTIDGKQYIADYVDVERGKLVTLIQAYKPTTCTEKDSGTNELFQFGKGMYEYSRFGLCNMLPITDGAESAMKIPAAFYFTGDYNLWCKIPQLTADSTVDDATAWTKKYKPVFYGVLATPTETALTAEEIATFKALASYYPVTNVSTTSDQLDGYTVFNYPISLAKGYDYIKQQLGDARDYLYGIDLMTAEAYVNSEYAAALAEIEV